MKQFIKEFWETSPGKWCISLAILALVLSGWLLYSCSHGGCDLGAIPVLIAIWSFVGISFVCFLIGCMQILWWKRTAQQGGIYQPTKFTWIFTALSIIFVAIALNCAWDGCFGGSLLWGLAWVLTSHKYLKIFLGVQSICSILYEAGLACATRGWCRDATIWDATLLLVFICGISIHQIYTKRGRALWSWLWLLLSLVAWVLGEWLTLQGNIALNNNTTLIHF